MASCTDGLGVLSKTSFKFNLTLTVLALVVVLWQLSILFAGYPVYLSIMYLVIPEYLLFLFLLLFSS